MAELPFNIGWIEWIASNRIDVLTDIFLFFTYLGNEEGYILIFVGLYWLFDKKIGFRVALALIFTSAINQILKVLISNARPFVNDGTYQENWAVSEETAEDLVDSYSTPSGHAQGSMTFWWYLHLKAKSRATFVLLFIMIFMVSFSRPYLGVHYIEDIILGWFVGFIVLLIFLRIEEPLAIWWNRMSESLRYILVIVIPIIIVIVSGITFSYNSSGQEFATYAGMISGLGIGIMLETKNLNFNPSLGYYKNKNVISKLAIGIGRYLLGAIISLGIFFGLDFLFAEIAADDTFVGFILRYIRYSTIGILAVYLAPVLFVRLNLAPIKS